jgi:hypothetical protein
MEMFLALAEQRNTIASRSTKVTFARFRDIVSSAVVSPPRSCWISGRYSLVSCPYSRISKDFGLFLIGLIFSTLCYRPTCTVQADGHNKNAGSWKV